MIVETHSGNEGDPSEPKKFTNEAKDKLERRGFKRGLLIYFVSAVKENVRLIASLLSAIGVWMI
jgi:hypothetical protein